MLFAQVAGLVVKNGEKKNGKFGESIHFQVEAVNKRGVKVSVSCVFYGKEDPDKFKKGVFLNLSGDLDLSVFDDEVKVLLLARYVDVIDVPERPKKEEKEFEMPF